jgi:hypothetical protein
MTDKLTSTNLSGELLDITALWYIFAFNKIYWRII